MMIVRAAPREGRVSERLLVVLCRFVRRLRADGVVREQRGGPGRKVMIRESGRAFLLVGEGE